MKGERQCYAAGMKDERKSSGGKNSKGEWGEDS